MNEGSRMVVLIEFKFIQEHPFPCDQTRKREKDIYQRDRERDQTGERKRGGGRPMDFSLCFFFLRGRSKANTIICFYF